jgi:hypothetical protein
MTPFSLVNTYKHVLVEYTYTYVVGIEDRVSLFSETSVPA